MGVLLLLAMAPVAAQTIVVRPGDPTWVFVQETATGAGAFGNGPATPPSGSGSASITVSGGGGELFTTSGQVLGVAGTKLSALTALQFSTYVIASDNPAVTATLQIEADYDVTDGNTAYQGRLVYEPYHLGVNPVPGTWQTWNALTGAAWWATGAPGNGTCPQSTPCTFVALVTAFPNVGFRNVGAANVVGFKVGSTPGLNATVAVDALRINGTLVDFEPAAPAAAVPALDGIGRALLALLLGMGAAVAMRRRAVR